MKNTLPLNTKVKCKGSNEVFTLTHKERNIFTFEDSKGTKRSYIYNMWDGAIYQGTNKNITVIKEEKNTNQIQQSLF
jgi:hypothetical protein